jgi:hypothetical protein
MPAAEAPPFVVSAGCTRKCTRTIVTTMLDAGLDLRDVQRAARHGTPLRMGWFASNEPQEMTLGPVAPRAAARPSAWGVAIGE